VPAILRKPFRREARNPPKIDRDSSRVRGGWLEAAGHDYDSSAIANSIERQQS